MKLVLHNSDGKVIKEMPMGKQTNEEWFCGLNTKEKAKVFVDIAQDNFYALRLQYYGEANDDVDAFAMWLKENHTE